MNIDESNMLWIALAVPGLTLLGVGVVALYFKSMEWVARASARRLGRNIEGRLVGFEGRPTVELPRGEDDLLVTCGPVTIRVELVSAAPPMGGDLLGLLSAVSRLSATLHVRKEGAPAYRVENVPRSVSALATSIDGEIRRVMTGAERF